mmetsp:Transcript_87044/g.153951  ORF Transcript_87044/g.153951 Transcript_87044/m.153951 type:complete len:261 (-) Transcript_87044:70-852(-)
MGNQCCTKPDGEEEILYPVEAVTGHYEDHHDEHADAVDHFELSGIILHDEESLTQSDTSAHMQEKFKNKRTAMLSRTRTLSNLGDIKSSDRLDRVANKTSSKAPLPEIARPNLEGSWTCIDTWGLDEFLKAMNIGYVQRMAASRAPWPSWEFHSLHPEGQDLILFVNHGALGDIEEEIHIGGDGYSAIDGRKQTISCKAYWSGDGESSKLIIERSGPQGEFIEERGISSGNLVFVLKAKVPPSSKEISWGRTFKLEPNPK